MMSKSPIFFTAAASVSEVAYVSAAAKTLSVIRIAIRARTGVAADCIELDVDVPNRLLIAWRPSFGDKTIDQIRKHHGIPQDAPEPHS